MSPISPLSLPACLFIIDVTLLKRENHIDWLNTAALLLTLKPLSSK